MVHQTFYPSLFLPCLSAPFCGTRWHVRLLLFHLYLTPDSWDHAFTGTYVLFELVIALLILDDYRLGKIRAPYIVCLVIFIVQHVAIYYVGEWEWWRELTSRLAELPL